MIDLKQILLDKRGDKCTVTEKIPSQDAEGFELLRSDMTLRYALSYCLLSDFHGTIPSEAQSEAKNYDFEIDSIKSKFDLFVKINSDVDEVDLNAEEIELVINLAVQKYDTLRAGQIINILTK